MVDFKGVLIDSFIDGSKLNYFSHKRRRLFEQLSILAISALILLVVGIVAAIYILRFTIQHELGKVNAQIVVSIINAIQIQILNYIYPVIAKALAEVENHRSSTGVSKIYYISSSSSLLISFSFWCSMRIV